MVYPKKSWKLSSPPAELYEDISFEGKVCQKLNSIQAAESVDSDFFITDGSLSNLRPMADSASTSHGPEVRSDHSVNENEPDSEDELFANYLDKIKSRCDVQKEEVEKNKKKFLHEVRKVLIVESGRYAGKCQNRKAILSKEIQRLQKQQQLLANLICDLKKQENEIEECFDNVKYFMENFPFL